MTEDPERSWAEKANETAVKMSHEILRTLIIIHGGATIAMLSFIGKCSWKWETCKQRRKNSRRTTYEFWLGDRHYNWSDGCRIFQ